MQTIPVVEAKAHFSALSAAVEAGDEVAITRRGKIVARVVPDRFRSAADLFLSIPSGDDIDLQAPEDLPPEPTGVAEKGSYPFLLKAGGIDHVARPYC